MTVSIVLETTALSIVIPDKSDMDAIRNPFWFCRRFPADAIQDPF